MELNEKDRLELAKMICENFPEYSISMDCYKWDYEKGLFSFYDVEEEKRYQVTTSKIADAIPKFFEGLNDKWFFMGVNELKTYKGIEDIACDFDSLATDGLLQLALFDDIVYG